jgi:fructan beta-fructosidase
MSTPNEQYRPAFHFTPEANWMNDPNGLVRVAGEYHLFYQYYPGATVWGPMHWGHAKSADLVRWERLPIALCPDPLGWIFSGSCVVDTDDSAGFGAGAMVAVFTYHNDAIKKEGRDDAESQGLAYSLDGGKSWTKYAGNPVLDNSGEADFRDPKAFRNETTGLWNLILAAGDRMKIYSSTNLREWKHESDFLPPVRNFSGVWECPDLFPLKADGETKWVMLASQTSGAPNSGSGTRYFVGDFDGKTFSCGADSRWLDWGKDFYAAATWNGVPNDRRILIGWMSNWQYAAKTPTKAWRSAMTLPRELGLKRQAGAYALVQKPAPEYEDRVTETFCAPDATTPFRAELNCPGVDIAFAFDGAAGGLSVELANDAGESFRIECDGETIQADRRASGQTDFSDDFAPGLQTMELGEPLRNVRIILDTASVELFVNSGSRVLTNQVFPGHFYTRLSIAARAPVALHDVRIGRVEKN